MIYLASPYTHPDPAVMEERFNKVTTVAAKLIHRGYMIYSPIMHFHPIAVRENLPRDYKYWQLINQKMIMLCDEVWILDLVGLAESKGCNEERQFAMANGVPVRTINPVAYGVER